MEMGNPIFILNGVISTGQFCAWLDAHDDNRNERKMWEFYLQKLGAWDERSFDEFRNEIMTGSANPVQKPTTEQTSATIKKSYEMFKNFDITREGG